MNVRIFGTLLIVIVVIATFVTLQPRVMCPSREEILIEDFPQLAKGLPEPMGAHASRDRFGIAQLIPDPFMRWESRTPEDCNYDAALGQLLAAQYALREEEESLWSASRAGVGVSFAQSRLDDARGRRDAAERAANEARLARDRSNDPAIVRKPGYSGVLIQRNTIVLRFREDASSEAIRDFIIQQHLTVRSGSASIALFVVEMDDAAPERTLDGDATRLRAVIDRLKDATNLVDTAVQNSLIGPNIVPRPSTVSRDWFRTQPPKDALVLSHFPEAWNFNQAIAARQSHVSVGVLDVGFDPEVCQQNDCDLDVKLTCTNIVDYHGTITASIIGATFNDGLGMDGAAPFATVFGCTPPDPPPCDASVPDDCSELKDQRRLFDGYVTALPTLLSASRARVVNASIGYNWSSVYIDPTNNAYVQALVADQGSQMRTLIQKYPDTILVSSAGNDSDRAHNKIQPAMWASPFNWAALYGPPAARSPNVIVVESLQDDGATSMPDSNSGGSIAAIGMNVLTIVSKGMYSPNSGTSVAAPLVTATIAQMWAVNTNLCPNPQTCGDVIKMKLGIGSGKPLNAFSAVRDSADDPDFDLANLVAPFDKVDRADFLSFKDGYKQVKAGVFTSDLNQDTKTNSNDGMFCRIDLDGNGVVDENDLDVLIRAWTGGLSPHDAAALHKELTQP
jgi:hypothetical protein